MELTIWLAKVAFGVAAFGFAGIGLVVVTLVAVNWLSIQRVRNSPPCPHGHADWDDCPDCCH